MDDEDNDDSFEIKKKEIKHQRKVEEFGQKMSSFYTDI